MRFSGGWNIAILSFLVLVLLFLNYLNIVPLSKLLSFLSFLPRMAIKESAQQLIPTPSPAWQSATQLIEEKKIPAPEKILEINLSYDENASPNLKIISVAIKNGYAPKYLPQDKGYQLRLLGKQNNLVSSLTFAIPNKIEGIPPPLEGEEQITIDPKDLILKKVDFTLTIPFIESAKNLQILDPQRKVIAIKDLVDVSIIDNKPNFESIPGANAPNKQSGLLDFLLPKTLAKGTESTDGYLDITFIGDDYKDKDMSLFEKNVNRSKDTLLTYEPFKTRASQFRFHKVYNTDDLECSRDPKLNVRIICNGRLVDKRVNDSGAPNDIIAVIVNNKKRGSAAMLSSHLAITNAPGYEHAFVHEIGHAVGNLLDEYVYSEEVGDLPEFPDRVNQNCYTGKPIREVWPGVPLSDYRPGCTHPNWYRSSKTSIMRDLKEHYFNVVSQRLLNEWIDRYAGPFSDIIPTPTSTPTPFPTVAQLQPTTLPTPTISSPYLETPTPTLTPTPFEEPTPKVELQNNCTVTFNWVNSVTSLTYKGEGGPPYTLTPHRDNPVFLKTVRNITETQYVFNNVYAGKYRADICSTSRTMYTRCAGVIAYAMCLTPTPTPQTNCIDTNCNGVDCALNGNVCRTDTSPCSCGILGPVAPTSPPVSIQKKAIREITINGSLVYSYLDYTYNPVINLRLSEVEEQEETFIIPVDITYSDGTTNKISLLFRYKPPLSPTPTLSTPSISAPKPSVLKTTKFYCAGSIDAYSCEFNAGGNTKGCCDKNGIARCISPNLTCDSPTLERATWFCGGAPGGQPYEYAACEDNPNNAGKTKECCYNGNPRCIKPGETCRTGSSPTPTKTPTPTPTSSCYSYQTQFECKSNNCDWVFLPEVSEYLCLDKGIE